MKSNRIWLLAALVALQPLGAAEPPRPAGDPELGFAIARQGDAALVQIRRESTRLAPPALPLRPENTVRGGAAADQKPTLEQTRARVRLIGLRRDVYFARPEPSP